MKRLPSFVVWCFFLLLLCMGFNCLIEPLQDNSWKTTFQVSLNHFVDVDPQPGIIVEKEVIVTKVENRLDEKMTSANAKYKLNMKERYPNQWSCNITSNFTRVLQNTDKVGYQVRYSTTIKYRGKEHVINDNWDKHHNTIRKIRYAYDFTYFDHQEELTLAPNTSYQIGVNWKTVDIYYACRPTVCVLSTEADTASWRIILSYGFEGIGEASLKDSLRVVPASFKSELEPMKYVCFDMVAICNYKGALSGTVFKKKV